MSIEEAEDVGFILRSIKLCEGIPDRLVKLHKEGKHEEVVRIACELSSEMKRMYEHQLSEYPSKKKV